MVPFRLPADRPRRRRPVAVGFLVAATLVLAACGGNSPDADPTTTAGDATTTPADTQPPFTNAPTTTDPGREPQNGGELVVGLDAESPGYHPHLDAWANSGHNVGRAVFDTLAVNDASGKPVPYLAESIEPNDDATVWTITLRSGITFHNGEALDADAVRLNLEAVLDSGQFKDQLSLVDTIEIVDELTVRLNMTTPWGTFPNVLVGDIGTQVGYMAAPEMLGQADGGRRPIGTGPFRFVEWVPDDRFVVERNDDYWQRPAYLDRVVFRPIPDSTSRKAAFDAGDIDVYATAATNQIVDFLAQQERGEVNVTIGAPSEPDVVMMNTRKAPLDDVRVRRALVMATDIPRLYQYLEATGVKQPLRGPYAESSFWYVESEYPEFDIEGAKALIDEYAAEVGPVSFEFAGGQDPFITGYQELFQSMWAEIGAEANIVSRAQGENLSTVIAGDYQVILWGGIGGGDPDADYNDFHSGPLNFSGFTTPEVDAALEAGRATGDPDERKAQYAIVQEALGRAVPFIWTGTNQFAVITARAVQDAAVFELPDRSAGQPILGGRFYLKDVWIEG
jgi:peptide/nickel transport system substrate-binding protein